MTKATLAIVLAAGEGTRMKSRMPKVLHKVAGASLLHHALNAVEAAGIASSAVVIGPNHEAVAAEALRVAPQARIFVQSERRGTGHAVLQARSAIEAGAEAIVVLFGDTPHVSGETIRRLSDAVRGDAAQIAVMGFRTTNPTGYGRLLMQGDELVAIREQKDATDEERAIDLCNGGLMALSGTHALSILDAIDDNNAQKEFYLTSAVEIARARGLKSTVVEVDVIEAFGVNDRVQLASAEATVQSHLRRSAMLGGVTMHAPETVFLSFDTKLGPDVIIEPHVFFGPGVTIGAGAIIHAYSHLEQTDVGENAHIGPFARLRPGTRLARGAKVGNFVEVKNATVGEGAKINHLSYVGDATVGAGANIGAGVITCNYNGFEKFATDIGANAFVGSNASLVAPVRIGAGAIVASGTVVTRDVEPDALAIARPEQLVKPGWATGFRQRPENAAKKKK